MNDPIHEITNRLRQFQPESSSIDRDELMFEAGRQSVQPTRKWQGMAGLLAFSQACTLAWIFLSNSAATPELKTNDRDMGSLLVQAVESMPLRDASLHDIKMDSIPPEQMIPSEPIWSVQSFRNSMIQ
jgi:hypothetical protein